MLFFTDIYSSETNWLANASDTCTIPFVKYLIYWYNYSINLKKKRGLDMRSKKRIISLLTAVLICFTLIQPSFAAEMNTNDKATALNKISILKGNGVDFNLSGKLIRSEAAAFIVRALGQEQNIYMNPSKYSTTKFPDVKVNTWYVPYIAYCVEQNIIGGYPNGNYGPDDYISEKSFLKLVLAALGYKVDVDYTWDNIYQVAYNVGIVTDAKYQTLSIDNTDYNREMVVSTLFNAMSKVSKVTGISLVQTLINNKIITKELAIATGIITDETITAIDSITVVSGTKLTIKLNDNVKNIVGSDITIYERDNTNVKLAVTIESQAVGLLTLKTSSQIADKNYVVKIAAIEDLNANKIANITKEFKGYKSIEVKSDFFKISKVQAVSKSVINVFFTQPVTANIAVPMFFEVLEGENSYVKGTFQTMSVKPLISYNNAITIFLKDKNLRDNAPYTLKINGEATSLFSIKLNEGRGDTANFTGTASENEEFYASSIMPIDRSTIMVHFNKDVDMSTAQQISNYTISSSNGAPNTVINAVVTGEGDSKGKMVMLRIIGEFDQDRIYELAIKDVQDNIKQNTVVADKFGFTGSGLQRSGLNIINVVPENKETLVVYFDKPLNNTTAINNGLYTITSDSYSVIPTGVYYDNTVNPYMVKLYLPSGSPLNASKSYKLSILSIMQDEVGNTSTSNSEYTFGGNGGDNMKPIMYEAMIIGSDTIRVRFTEEVSANAPNNVSSNYILEYKDGDTSKTKTPSSVSFVDANTMILKFNSLSYDTNYKLRFIQLMDYSGINIRTAADGLDNLDVQMGNN